MSTTRFGLILTNFFNFSQHYPYLGTLWNAKAFPTKLLSMKAQSQAVMSV